jgi:hypothetical protein
MMRVVALQTKFEVPVVFPVVLVLQMERTRATLPPSRSVHLWFQPVSFEKLLNQPVSFSEYLLKPFFSPFSAYS